MKYILFALALAAVGLAFAMAAVILARPCGPGCGAFVVLPVSGHMDDIELRIRKLVRESRGLPGAAIVIADLGVDSETADICRMICREFEHVSMIKGEEMTLLLGKSDDTGKKVCQPIKSE